MKKGITNALGAFATSYMSGWMFWLALGAGATALGGAYLYHTSAVKAAYKDGVAAQVLAGERQHAKELEDQQTEVDRLQIVNKELQDEVTRQTSELAAFERVQRTAERLRATERQVFVASLAGATTDALRRHAETTDGDIERCREHVERFGREAFTGSVAAWALANTIAARNAEVEARRQAIIQRRDSINPTKDKP